MPRRRVALLLALGLPGALVLGFFFFLPLAAVSEAAFIGGLGGFRRLFETAEFWSAVRNTLVLGVSAGALSLCVGCAVAYHLAQLGEGARTALLFLIALPLTFSGLIVAFGFILAFGRAGVVTIGAERLLGIPPADFSAFVVSPAGLVLAYCYYLIPRVVMLLLPVLVNFDRAQLQAAESLGASRLRALADILAPQVFPTAFAAFCLIVAVAFGTYGTALALVGTQVNILPLQLFALVSDAGTDFPTAAALAIVMTALCTLAIGLGEWVAIRKGKD